MKSSFVLLFRISIFFRFSFSLFDTTSQALLPTNLVLFKFKIEENVERHRLNLKPDMKHVLKEQEDLQRISAIYKVIFTISSKFKATIEVNKIM